MFGIFGSDIKQIDSSATEKYLIPPIVLMENAAIASCNSLTSKWNFSSCLIVCGHGNNGGDGFALARHLSNRNYKVRIVLIGNEKKFSYETKTNFLIARKLKIEFYVNPQKVDFKRIVSASDITVDALFGTGFHGNIDSFYRKYFKIINSSSKRIFSLDIPSGIDSDTGEFDSDSINADMTVTFGFVKTGLLWNKTIRKSKELVIADISIPPVLAFSVKHFVILEKEILSAMVSDSKDSKEWIHKTEKGKVSFIGGNSGMEGSIQLASAAALKSGTGIVYTYMVSKSEKKFFPEIVFTKNLETTLEKSDVWVAGCGLGTSKESVTILNKINLMRKGKTVVYDADALNIISKMNDKEKISFLNGSIITPHPEEFFRLSKMRFSNIKEKITAIENFSKKYRTLVILKSPPTIITDSKISLIFPNMSPKLATAGSGDILAGILGGFISQGFSPIVSASLSVYVHFYSGYNTKNDNPSASEFLQNISNAKSEVINA